MHHKLSNMNEEENHQSPIKEDEISLTTNSNDKSLPEESMAFIMSSGRISMPSCRILRNPGTRLWLIGINMMLSICFGICKVVGIKRIVRVYKWIYKISQCLSKRKTSWKAVMTWIFINKHLPSAREYLKTHLPDEYWPLLNKLWSYTLEALMIHVLSLVFHCFPH
jgi:hypothetical protein